MKRVVPEGGSENGLVNLSSRKKITTQPAGVVDRKNNAQRQMKAPTFLRSIFVPIVCGAISLSAPPVFALNVDRLADADNGFAFDLLKQIAKEEPHGNIFISPFSAATALQMVANGATGETKNEMRRVLKTAGIRPAGLNAACQKLNQSLEAQTNVILDLANSIWYRDDIPMVAAFVSDNNRFFQAKLGAVNFFDPKTAGMINGWAEKATRGKVKNIVRYPFDPDTALVIANAIYFKGKWAEPFDKNLTLPRDFHLGGGAVKPVPMMSKSQSFGYQEGDGFQAVELPYVGDRLQMILFLPATNSSLQQLLKSVSGKAWRDKMSPGFADCEGFLAFPKFKLDYEVILNDSLEALGMNLAFDHSHADFSAMANDPGLAVKEVTQNSCVAVDEEGTEAAAVTSVNMTDAALPMEPPKTFEMIVDRPFFFLIADRQTQTILFMGMVNNPAP